MQANFFALKDFLMTPPILARALPKEALKIYLSACDRIVEQHLSKLWKIMRLQSTM